MTRSLTNGGSGGGRSILAISRIGAAAGISTAGGSAVMIRLTPNTVPWSASDTTADRPRQAGSGSSSRSNRGSLTPALDTVAAKSVDGGNDIVFDNPVDGVVMIATLTRHV